MADETTPLLPAHGTTENDGQRPQAWTRYAQVSSIFPVVIVIAFNYGFHHNIVPELLPKLLAGSTSFRSMAIAAGAFSSFLSTPFWTALSDRAGRRAVLLIGTLGATIPNICLALICTTGDYYALYLPGIFLEGLLGGFTTFRAVMYAYVADCTSAGPRLAMFSVLQGLIYLAFFAPDYYMFRALDLNDLGELFQFVRTLLVVLGIAFFYVLFCIPKSWAHERPPENQGLSGIKIWIPSNLFSRSSLFALALCIYSFIPAVEEGYGTRKFRRDTKTDPGFVDMILKTGRYFIVIPVLELYRARVFYIEPLQWSFRLAFLSPLLVVGASFFCIVLALTISLLLPEGCTFFCFSWLFIIVLNFFLIIVIPNLCNAGGLPSLYSLLAGCYQREGRQFEWGLLFGRLSILQSLSELIIGELEDVLVLVQPFPGYVVVQLTTSGLLWLGRSRIAS